MRQSLSRFLILKYIERELIVYKAKQSISQFILEYQSCRGLPHSYVICQAQTSLFFLFIPKPAVCFTLIFNNLALETVKKKHPHDTLTL